MRVERTFIDDVLVREHCYDDEGNTHNENAPAIITINNGVLITESWYKHGDLHRLDGRPCKITRYENGNIESETFCIDDVENDGWSYVFYHKNGMIAQKFHYENGRLNNKDDAAYIRYNDLGEVIGKEYYIDGCPYDYKSWLVESGYGQKVLSKAFLKKFAKKADLVATKLTNYHDVMLDWCELANAVCLFLRVDFTWVIYDKVIYNPKWSLEETKKELLAYFEEALVDEFLKEIQS